MTITPGGATSRPAGTAPDLHRPGRKPPPIALCEEERRELERTARAATSSQRDATRARIILLADQGLSNREIARTLGLDEDTVSKWRKRFHEGGPTALRDRPRSGRPRRFSAEQVTWVLQKATEWPTEHGFPFSHWDAKALAELAQKVGIVEDVHPTTIWRWLHKADLKPHRVHHWLHHTDPDFGPRMEDVTRLYLSVPELSKQGVRIFSLDEKTSIQALERKAPALPPIPHRPHLIEHEYKRHGTLCLTAGFNVATGTVRGILTPHRPATVFASFVEELCLSEAPDAPKIHLVVDQLSTHWHHELCQVVARLSGIPYDPQEYKNGSLRKAFLMRDDKRIVVHFTPKHASWLNQIEIWFSVLVRKLLHRGSFRSLEELREAIERFIAYYNRYLAHPYRWTYTGTPCCA